VLHRTPPRGAPTVDTRLAGQKIDDLVAAQTEASAAAVTAALGPKVEAIYLYGSAVSGGLKPHSDLDLFVVAGARTTVQERLELAARLKPISAKGFRPPGWRPLEVTIAAHADLPRLATAPRTDFQYGEWLRDRFDAGLADPERPDNQDLILLATMVRRTARTLHGPPADELIPDVPTANLNAALIDVIPELFADLDSDAANVLLTLARIWRTLTTGDFVAKNDAGDWAIPRLPDVARPALDRARKVYTGEADDEWHGFEQESRHAAAMLRDAISSAATAEGR
jgi:predicted nucleotidyltransferase